MRVVLLRHGVAVDQAGRATGHDDPALSPEGAAAVVALRDAHAGDLPSFIWASDLRRAHETATLLADRWQLPVRTDARLREMHFGRWDGRLWSEIEANDASAMQEWMSRWWEATVPEGESFAALQQRALAWWHECLVPAAAVGETQWVVAHAGTIRALVAGLTGAPAERSFDLPCGHARAVHLQIEDGRVTLVSADQTSLA